MPDDDALAIGGGGGAAVGIGGVGDVRLIPGDGLHPKLLAGGAVEAVEASANALFIFGAGDEDFAAGNDGAAVSALRQFRPPFDVFVFAPFQWKFGFCGFSIAIRAAEKWPVLGVRLERDQKKDKRPLQGTLIHSDSFKKGVDCRVCRDI